MQYQEETQDVRLSALVDVPEAMIIELAVGVNGFDDICRKYNYNTSQIEQLKANEPFRAKIIKMESELTREGYTNEFRARWLADVSLRILHERLIDPRTPTPVVLDIHKEMVKNGNLGPKPNVAQTGNGGYSITINLPQMGEQPGRTIEMNRDVSTICEPEPLLGRALTVSDRGTLNRNMNSSLELPEDWQDE